MVVFKQGKDIIIMHNHSFSVIGMYHAFDLIYIFKDFFDNKIIKIREEKDIEVKEINWEKYMRNLGEIQKEPIEVDF